MFIGLCAQSFWSILTETSSKHFVSLSWFQKNSHIMYLDSFFVMKGHSELGYKS